MASAAAASSSSAPPDGDAQLRMLTAADGMQVLPRQIDLIRGEGECFPDSVAFQMFSSGMTESEWLHRRVRLSTKVRKKLTTWLAKNKKRVIQGVPLIAMQFDDGVTWEQMCEKLATPGEPMDTVSVQAVASFYARRDVHLYISNHTKVQKHFASGDPSRPSPTEPLRLANWAGSHWAPVVPQDYTPLPVNPSHKSGPASDDSSSSSSSSSSSLPAPPAGPVDVGQMAALTLSPTAPQICGCSGIACVSWRRDSIQRAAAAASQHGSSPFPAKDDRSTLGVFLDSKDFMDNSFVMPFPDAQDVDTFVDIRRTEKKKTTFDVARLFRCSRWLWAESKEDLDGPVVGVIPQQRFAPHRLVVSTAEPELLAGLRKLENHGVHRVQLWRTNDHGASSDSALEHWALSVSRFVSLSYDDSSKSVPRSVYKRLSVSLKRAGEPDRMMQLDQWRLTIVKAHDYCTANKIFHRPLNTEARPAHKGCPHGCDAPAARPRKHQLTHDPTRGKQASGRGRSHKSATKQRGKTAAGASPASNMSDETTATDDEEAADRQEEESSPSDDTHEGAQPTSKHRTGNRSKHSGDGGGSDSSDESTIDSECDDWDARGQPASDINNERKAEAEGSGMGSPRRPNPRAIAIAAAKKQFKFEMVFQFVAKRTKLNAKLACSQSDLLEDSSLNCPVPLELMEFNHLQLKTGKKDKQMNWGSISATPMLTILRELRKNYDAPQRTWKYSLVCAEHHRRYHHQERAAKPAAQAEPIRRTYVNSWMHKRWASQTRAQSNTCESWTTGFPCLWGSQLPLRVGEEYLFDLDHIDRGTKVANISKLAHSASCSKQKMDDELSKVRTLHASCHKRHTHQVRIDPRRLPSGAPPLVRQAAEAKAASSSQAMSLDDSASADSAAYSSILNDLRKFKTAMEKNDKKQQDTLIKQYQFRHVQRKAQKPKVVAGADAAAAASQGKLDLELEFRLALESDRAAAASAPPALAPLAPAPLQPVNEDLLEDLLQAQTEFERSVKKRQQDPADEENTAEHRRKRAQEEKRNRSRSLILDQLDKLSKALGMMGSSDPTTKRNGQIAQNEAVDALGAEMKVHRDESFWPAWSEDDVASLYTRLNQIMAHMKDLGTSKAIRLLKDIALLLPEQHAQRSEYREYVLKQLNGQSATDFQAKLTAQTTNLRARAARAAVSHQGAGSPAATQPLGNSQSSKQGRAGDHKVKPKNKFEEMKLRHKQGKRKSMATPRRRSIAEPTHPGPEPVKAQRTSQSSSPSAAAAAAAAVAPPAPPAAAGQLLSAFSETQASIPHGTLQHKHK